jgi:hypothetical protein
MTEIIDISTRRARPVTDLTKHDTDPTPTDGATDAPPRVLEGVVIPSDDPAAHKSRRPRGGASRGPPAACRWCDAARHHP